MSTTLDTLVQRTRRFLRDYPTPADTTSASLSSSVTTVPVADGTQFVKNWVIEVDYEAMLVTNVSSNNLTVRRGWAGSTAATHVTSSTVSIRPGFLTVEIIDGLNAGIDACFPYIYKAVSSENTGDTSTDYEYNVPYVSGTTTYIPRITKLQYQSPGDTAFHDLKSWTVVRGSTPLIKLRTPLLGGGVLRVIGLAPFPHLAASTDTLDALWPGTADNLPVLYAASQLLASGEAGRVRQDTGARDDRESATRTGSSLGAGRDLYQRFANSLISGCHMAPMSPHVVVMY